MTQYLWGVQRFSGLILIVLMGMGIFFNLPQPGLFSQEEPAQENEEEYDGPVGELKIVIEGFKNDKGDVKITVDNNEDAFYAKKAELHPFIGVIGEIRDLQSVFVIAQLPYGEYAVKVFHDENQNNTLDTNYIGLPTESYGFSNNVSSFGGIPDFKKAKFRIESQQTMIVINLK